MCFRTIVKKSVELTAIAGVATLANGFYWNNVLKAEVVKVVKEETTPKFDQLDKKYTEERNEIRDALKTILNQQTALIERTSRIEGKLEK